MANPFEDFVQLEVAKRPFLDTDAPEETLFVRRGAAPKQMQLLNIADGEALVKVAGKLTGVPISSLGGGSTMYTHKQLDSASNTWTVSHGKNNRFFTCNIYSSTGKQMVPDEIEAVDANTVIITFNTPLLGYAVFSFDTSAV